MCNLADRPVRALLAIVLLWALPAAAAPPDGDFQPERVRSVAMGPLPGGRLLPSLELGWLRSGARLDLGLVGGFDLVLRADSMLLFDGLGGQNGAHLGLRFTPFAEDVVRLGFELSVGQVLVTARANTVSLTAVRGELVLGALLDLGNVYVRLAMRGVDADVSGLGWSRDEEAGLGVERTLGRFVLGAEASSWARPRHGTLAQWRIRVGFAP